MNDTTLPPLEILNNTSFDKVFNSTSPGGKDQDCGNGEGDRTEDRLVLNKCLGCYPIDGSLNFNATQNYTFCNTTASEPDWGLGVSEKKERKFLATESEDSDGESNDSYVTTVADAILHWFD